MAGTGCESSRSTRWRAPGRPRSWPSSIRWSVTGGERCGSRRLPARNCGRGGSRLKGSARSARPERLPGPRTSSTGCAPRTESGWELSLTSLPGASRTRSGPWKRRTPALLHRMPRRVRRVPRPGPNRGSHRRQLRRGPARGREPDLRRARRLVRIPSPQASGNKEPRSVSRKRARLSETAPASEPGTHRVRHHVPTRRRPPTRCLVRASVPLGEQNAYCLVL
jgi:hypothetical protein